MKTLRFLLNAIIFTTLTMMIISFAQGAGTNLLSPELLTIDDLRIIPMALLGYFLISAYFILLTSQIERACRDSKNLSVRVSIKILVAGLISGMIVGFISGLIAGIIFGFIFESMGWLIPGIIFGLIFGLIVGLIIGLITEE